MASLELGVVDVAYSDANGGDGTTTTYDVAKILEERYGVMATFYDLREEKIIGYIKDAMEIQIQDLFRGITTPGDPMAGAEQRINNEFKRFLNRNEMQKLSLALSGAPISAAAMRSNQRKKQPYSKRNKARPAFIDSGLYLASFRSTIKL